LFVISTTLEGAEIIPELERRGHRVEATAQAGVA
jgi:hypothetical protein